ncbi:hypothetical protein FKP32DRAFT_1546038, partial [Trametes sanguinea]
MKAFVKTLLGFDPKSNAVNSGVLGVVKAYYGCVEAQGRGSLHCHMLVWVEGGLNPDQLQAKLRDSDDPDFGRRLLAFLEDTISTAIPDIPSDSEHTFRRPNGVEPHPSSHRGFDLDDTDTDRVRRFRAFDMRNLVESSQLHTHTATCYKYCGDGPKRCRFDLDEDNVVPESSIDTDTGDISLKIINGMVNNYNPTMLEALRCNMDISHIGSGEEAKAVIYYVTDYITKSPLKAHIAYASLETAIKKVEADTQTMPANDSQLRAKKMLQKSAFALISNQELSAQQVSSYLMDYEDHFTSHRFANLYWTSLERHISALYPRDSGPQLSINAPADDGSEPSIQEPNTHSDEVMLGRDTDGQLCELSTQLADYIHRSDDLENISVWEFVSSTRK